MDEQDLEGTLVLEKLAEFGLVEAFFDAIDSDDIAKAKALMQRARIDSVTVAMIVRKMAEADGAH